MRYAIEHLFRRHFYVVHLGGLTVAALLCASTASELAAYELEPVRANHASSEVESVDVERRDFVAAANANIFEGRREIVDDVPLQAPPDASDGDCESAPRSTLRLRLVGAVVFEDPALSLASIVDETGGRHAAEVFSIQTCDDVGTNDPCDRIGTLAHLRRIEPERVCVWNDADQRLESLALDDGPTMVSTTRTAPSSVPPNAKGGGPELNVRELGGNRYEVTRAEVEGLLNQPELLAMPATIAFENGAPVGVKLGRVPANSLYAKIGLKRGDIVNRVNGYDISNPAKGLEIYGKLRDASQIVVDVTRGGAKQTMEYSIVP